jgi:spermidine/putrescine ABC transporter ATP-binding subunit
VAEAALALHGLEKRFGDHAAVAGIDLLVRHGEFVTLLGPSGCGKTTTLNLVAGFMPPSAGTILLDGRSMDGLPPFRRDLGVVFQDYALFPHMTVAENVAFGLRMRGVPKTQVGARVEDALAMVKLGGFGDRRPQHLSGGQRQRVALARALVIRPKMLLLDEPLSNLDLKLREEMRLEIAQLQRQLGIATVFVTHDQGEALALSDRVAVMNAGRIEQYGTPAEIYERPRSRFVAAFIGNINIVPASVRGGPNGDRLLRLDTPLGDFLATADDSLSPGTPVDVAFRPERVLLYPAPPALDAPATVLSTRVVGMVYLGARTELRLATEGGQTLLVDAPNDRQHARYGVGTPVHAVIRADDCRVLADR